MADNQEEIPKKPANSDFSARMVDVFGGVKEFNTAMAIMGPSVINVLQTQVDKDSGMIAMYQLGSGLLSFSGNFLFFKNGDPSMHSRMGMLSGALKTLLGVTLFGVGMARFIAQDDSSNTMMALGYLGYCSKTLSTVIDLFSAASYGKDAMSATRELAMKRA